MGHEPLCDRAAPHVGFTPNSCPNNGTGTWGARSICMGFSASHLARTLRTAVTSAFRRRLPNHFVPIDPGNAATTDWAILLEANTIVGSSGGRLRVARTTQEREVVKRRKLFRRHPFLVVEGFDPRIHALYFCPQLYRYEDDDRLVPLDGEEIGKLVARGLERSVKPRLPWYEPTDKLPGDRIITSEIVTDLDTLVVDEPPKKPARLPSAAE